MKRTLLSRTAINMAYGDCSRKGCHHSIIYHVVLIGCMKCDCDEYK